MTPRRPDGALEATGTGRMLAALSRWTGPHPVTGGATRTITGTITRIATGPAPDPALPRHRGR
ncbi:MULTISPECIES: hypothetical protein [Protofrankia]|uniref:hypothetical protein n=1 Tax=Protofrankia TaxID=2994361 RepID=UPI00030093E0|nr:MULTISPECIES: hypothetical protein [Protofrankia]